MDIGKRHRSLSRASRTQKATEDDTALALWPSRSDRPSPPSRSRLRVDPPPDLAEWQNGESIMRVDKVDDGTLLPS